MRYKIVTSSMVPKTQTAYSHHCYLGISLENQFFKGKHVGLLLSWIDKRFPGCLIIIGDHLNRINEQISKRNSMDEAIEASLKLGDVVEERFQNEIEKLSKNKFILHRWQQYYEDEDVKVKKADLHTLYNTHKELRDSIQTSCREFVNRQISRGNILKVNENRAIGLSSDYIIEEIAVFQVLIERGYRVQVYPGSHLNTFKKFANAEFPDIKTSLSTGIYIDLSVKKIGK
jgi:tRNA-dependent cyclodipeptide synthase